MCGWSSLYLGDSAGIHPYRRNAINYVTIVGVFGNHLLYSNNSFSKHTKRFLIILGAKWSWCFCCCAAAFLCSYFLLDSGRKPQVVQNIISKEILRILRNSKGKREPESPQGNGAKCFPGAAAPESKRLPVGPLQKKLPGTSSHFFELCGSDFGNFIFLRISKDP